MGALDGELVDDEEVAVTGVLEVEELGGVGVFFAVRFGVFDIDAVTEEAVKVAVAGDRVGGVEMGEDVDGVGDRFWG